MAIIAESEKRIPVICADLSCVKGAEIFNPNSWSGGAKGVIQSCWTEYSVLHYCVGQISAMCTESERLCEKNIGLLRKQWRIAKFDLHIRIEAFFSGVKTLLDLLVQLLSAEKIVVGGIDGFHREKNEYCDRVLNVLKGNAVKERKDAAVKLYALISEHKKLWIDQVIQARNNLLHPEKGMHQLMFNLELSEKDGELICKKAHPPEINSKPIHVYAQDILKQITALSSSFLAVLGETAVSNDVRIRVARQKRR